MYVRKIIPTIICYPMFKIILANIMKLMIYFSPRTHDIYNHLWVCLSILDGKTIDLYSLIPFFKSKLKLFILINDKTFYKEYLINDIEKNLVINTIKCASYSVPKINATCIFCNKKFPVLESVIKVKHIITETLFRCVSFTVKIKIWVTFYTWIYYCVHSNGANVLLSSIS